jgi:hypothetical protein
VVARHFYFPNLFREFGSGREAAEVLFRPAGRPSGGKIRPPAGWAGVNE